MYTCKTWIDEAGQIVSLAYDVRTKDAHRLTILTKSADLVWNKWYLSRKSAMDAMRRMTKNRIEVVFADDLMKLPRAKLEKKYRAEIEWLRDLTAYEWKPGLVAIDKDDAMTTLDMWEKELDDVPRKFTILHGYELLMVLWNQFIA